eukprot:gene26119-biopygen14169
MADVATETLKALSRAVMKLLGMFASQEFSVMQEMIEKKGLEAVEQYAQCYHYVPPDFTITRVMRN